MLSGAETDDFTDGRLELNCGEMVLCQNEAAVPKRYAGMGHIRQDDDRRLVFKLFCAEPRRIHPKAYLDEINSLKLGQLIPCGQYYTLTATDLQGRTWTGHKVRIDMNAGEGIVLTGGLDSIVHKAGSREGRDSVSLDARLDARIQCNLPTHTRNDTGVYWRESSSLNAAEISACSSRFTIRQEVGRLLIDAVSEGPPFSAYAETRIVEALQFVLGQTLRWSLMVKRFGGEESVCLRSDRSDSKSRMSAPLDLNNRPVGDEVWALCRAYLDHIWSLPRETMHPISAWLHFVRKASTGSIFTRGLAVAVAVEGIAHAAFRRDSDVPDPAKIDSAIHHLKLWDGDERLKKRIESAVSAMRNPRAKDVLIRLATKGIVTQGQFQAWNTLRNQTAHATPPSYEDEELQRWINLCHCVETMLYRMIFSAIGYQGVFTDYSAPDWPEAHFKVRHADDDTGVGAT